MRDRLTRWFRSAVDTGRRCRAEALGLLSGTLVCLWWTQTLVALGGTLTTLSGLFLAAAVGVAWGWQQRPDGLPTTAAGVRWMLLGVWTIVLPALTAAPFAVLRYISIERLATPESEFLFAVSAGLLLLTAPHYWLATLTPCDSRHRAQGTVAPSLIGLAAALLIVPSAVLPGVGVPLVAVTAAGLSILCGAMWQWRSDVAESRPLSAAVRRAASATSAPRQHLNGFELLVPLAAGGLLGLAGRVSGQLWLTGLYCGFAAAAGVLLGVAITRRVNQSDWGQTSGVVPGMCIAASAAVLLGSFRLWTALALWINADVSSLSLIVGLRTASCALLALPAGIGWGLALPPDGGHARRPLPTVQALMFVLGWILFRWTMHSTELAGWVLLLAGLVAAVAAAVRSGQLWPAPLSARCLLTAALAACLAAPWLMPQYDPARSARLLFSARVAVASHSPADAGLLEALDDSRLVRVREGADSTWTHWANRGDLLLWRENGYPHGAVSLHPEVTPESAAEMMTALIPLTVHPQAERVLVVGAGSGATLQSTLEFPVQTVTCWEPDADAVELLSETLTGSAGARLDDPRLSLRRVQPRLAAATKNDTPFDVVILNERQQATWRAIGQSHVEQLRRYAALLADDGLLCVRFEYIDFGAGPVLDLTRTLAAVFPQVLLWESAPGELLFLASPSEQPLIDESLLARFQTPQARRVLGQVGWDCSLPLSLVTVFGTELLAANPDQGVTATAARAYPESVWPLEIARWGLKGQEIQRLLAPVARTALARLPASPERSAVEQRLADVQEQRSLVTRFPDHYWAYRKVLRERLQERPRTTIQQLKHELHPEDERRKQYLEALGAAATAESPTGEQLQEIAGFTQPFDPLVSPFLHREVAHLFARVQPAAPAAELDHWLRAVYVSPHFDRSIRDATAALQLLVSQPEALSDAQRRWDHVNALLEVLKERWSLRSQHAATSRFDTVDAQETIAAAQAGLDFLEAQAADVGVDPEWAAVRCRVLDRTLVRALRSHHAQQVAQQQEQQRRQAAREQSNVESR